MGELVKCPKCGTTYRVAPERLGRTANCKTCNERFTLTPAAEGTRQSQAFQQTGRASAAAPNREASQKIGRFELRGRLGAGAFGAVYRAYDPVLEREVALKVPHAGLLGSEKDEARFLREPKAAAQLRHPNIVPVYDAGFDGEYFYIASAFVEGKTLQEAIRPRPEFRETAATVMRLAEGLDYAHNQGIVHRDVKPANVMLDRTGEPLLMDFGLARIQESADKLTLDGTIMGTPAYMPPEQASGSVAEVGPAADQYSLGVVLYEMLCGELPFNGPPELVISLVLHQEPPSPRIHDATIPRDLETICLKAMSKDIRGRYENCGELAADLRRWLDDLPIRARPLGPVERAARWAKRNPLIAGMALALMVVLVLGTAISSLFALEAGRRAKEALVNERTAIANAERADKNAAAKDAVLTELQREKKHVEEQKRIADEQRDEARRQTMLATQRFEHALRSAYNTQLARVQDVWQNDPQYARRLLDDRQICPDRFRGFAWQYFHQLTDRQRLRISVDAADDLRVAVSPDGKMLAVGASRGSDHPQSIQLFELPSGKEFAQRQGYRGSIRGMAFSPDSRVLATGGGERAIFLWNMPQGTEMARLEGHKQEINALVFSPDGKTLVSGAGSALAGELKRWNLTTRTPQDIKRDQDDPIHSVAFSHDGKMLAAGGDASVFCFDTRTYKPAYSMLSAGTGSRTFVAFSPTAPILAAGGTEGTIRLWNVDDWKLLATVRAHYAPIVALTFSPNGGVLISGGGDNRIKVWSTESLEEQLAIPCTEALLFMAFAPPAKTIVTAHAWSTIRLWNVDTAVARTLRWAKADVDRLAFSSDGTIVAASGSVYDPQRSRRVDQVKVWNMGTGRELYTLDDQIGSVSDLTVSANGKCLATCGTRAGRSGGHGAATGDDEARIWDLQTGQLLFDLDVPGGGNRARFSPDNRWLALGSDTGVTIWDTKSGTRRFVLERNLLPTFSPDGGTLATIGSKAADDPQDAGSCCVRLWNVPEFTSRGTIGKWPTSAADLLYSPDGGTIAVAHNLYEQNESRWRVSLCSATGEAEDTAFENNGRWLSAIAFSSDGKILATADSSANGKESELAFWDPMTGQHRLTLLRKSEPIKAVAWSPDGKRLASATGREVITVWDLNSTQR